MKGSRLKTLAAILLVCAAAAALAACSIIGTALRISSAVPTATTAQASTAAPATASPKATASPVATAEPTASPTATPAPTASPDPDAQYYSDTEKVTVDPAGGHWVYQSTTLSVDVKQVTTKKPNLNYYVADIRTRDVGLLQSCYAGDDHSGKVRAVPEKIATKNKCVIAVTSDYFNNPYTSGTNKKGIIIRDGQLRSDKKGADCLAILPSGEFKDLQARRNHRGRAAGDGRKERLFVWAGPGAGRPGDARHHETRPCQAEPPLGRRHD
jgi:hypothetical protein